MRERIQLLNIRYEGHCEDCKFCFMSDLFFEPLCLKCTDTHILYPDVDGTEECPFFELAD